MRIETSFPGGVRVDADVHGFRIRTDQPVDFGGDGTAPPPFDLFLASLATCAGFYAVQFCRKREIATEGLAVAVETFRHPETRRIDEVRIEVTLPDDFPERYVTAIERAIDQCAVKRVIELPPRMATVVVAPTPTAA